MDTRAAAELLYESEATLRMVDTALDELQIGQHEPSGLYPRLEIHGAGSQPSTGRYDFQVRAYWQVQEAAECVRDGREVLQAARAEGERGAGEGEGGDRLDRVLAIIDHLEALDPEAARDRSALLDALRGEMVDAFVGDGGARSTGKQISLALSLLAEAEGRLTRLGHAFGSQG